MTIEAVLKKIFAPRKVAKRSVKVTLSAPSRKEWLAKLRQDNTQAVVDFLQAVEDFANSPDAEYQRMVDTAKVLGFPEVQHFDDEATTALVAATEYHNLSSDTDANQALAAIAKAVKEINEGDYTFLDDVYDDLDLGQEILQRIEGHRDFPLHWSWLFDYVDAEELAENTRKDEGGQYTVYGYFQYGELVF